MAQNSHSIPTSFNLTTWNRSYLTTLDNLTLIDLASINK